LGCYSGPKRTATTFGLMRHFSSFISSGRSNSFLYCWWGVSRMALITVIMRRFFWAFPPGAEGPLSVCASATSLAPFSLSYNKLVSSDPRGLSMAKGTERFSIILEILVSLETFDIFGSFFLFILFDGSHFLSLQNAYNPLLLYSPGFFVKSIIIRDHSGSGFVRV
jgi:hypothetical protein